MIVFDDEHAAAAARRTGFLAGAAWRCQRRFRAAGGCGTRCPCRALAAHVHRAAVHVHQQFHDREPDAQTALARSSVRSPCRNRSNRCGRSWASMPTPVSRTRHHRPRSPCFRRRFRCGRRSGEYLLALVSRFDTTWQSRTLSPLTKLRSPAGERSRSDSGARARLHGFEGRLHHASRLDRFASEHHAATGDTRHVEQVVDQVCEVARPAARSSAPRAAPSPYRPIPWRAHRPRCGWARAGCAVRAPAWRGTHPCAGRLRAAPGRDPPRSPAPDARRANAFCNSCMRTAGEPAISRKNTTCAIHWVGRRVLRPVGEPDRGQHGREHARQQRRPTAAEVARPQDSEHERQQGRLRA